MANLALQNVSFSYGISNKMKVNNINIALSSKWKTGLISAERSGKTELLNIINKSSKPSHGLININIKTSYFPFQFADENKSVVDLIRDEIIKSEDEELESTSLHEFPKTNEVKIISNKPGPDFLIVKEISRIGLPQKILQETFSNLSVSEKILVQIASLFLKENNFPLLDEPENLLEQQSIQLLGDYLAGASKGFMIASDNRHLLDLCTTHTIAINKNSISVNRGNYSVWKLQKELEEDYEKRKLEAELYVNPLNNTRLLSLKRRTIKINGEQGNKSAGDQSHSESRSLSAYEPLLTIEKLSLEVSGEKLIQDFSLRIYSNERAALNIGSGIQADAFMRTLRGIFQPAEGEIRYHKNFNPVFVYKNIFWQKGFLGDLLSINEIDEDEFLKAMDLLKINKKTFDEPLENSEKDILRKIDICRSFVGKNNILIWEEPLNYLNIFSRELLEEIILEIKPTMLVIEKDKLFLSKTATKYFDLGMHH
jgi:lincosamide and streptogramin A transport system ATP-binding/permease protein